MKKSRRILLTRIDPRAEGGGQTRAKSGEVEGGGLRVEGGHRADQERLWRTADGGQREVLLRFSTAVIIGLLPIICTLYMLLNGSLDRYKNIWLKYVPYFHGIMFYRLLIGVIRLRLPRERIENRLYMSPVSPVFHTEVTVNLLKTFCLGTRTYYYQIITKEYEANTQYMLPKSFNICFWYLKGSGK